MENMDNQVTSSSESNLKTMKSTILYAIILALMASISLAAPTSESKVCTNYILHVHNDWVHRTLTCFLPLFTSSATVALVLAVMRISQSDLWIVFSR